MWDASFLFFVLTWETLLIACMQYLEMNINARDRWYEALKIKGTVEYNDAAHPIWSLFAKRSSRDVRNLKND